MAYCFNIASLGGFGVAALSIGKLAGARALALPVFAAATLPIFLVFVIANDQLRAHWISPVFIALFITSCLGSALLWWRISTILRRTAL